MAALSVTRSDRSATVGPCHAPGRNVMTAQVVPVASSPRPVPPFTPQHEQLRARIRAYVERELAPRAEEWEAAEWFPNEVFTALAAQGWLALKFQAEYGGGGDA